MTLYIPDDSTYYAADSGPGLLALVLVGLAIVVAAWALVPKLIEMLRSAIAADNYLADLEAAFADAEPDMRAVTAGMRAGFEARAGR